MCFALSGLNHSKFPEAASLACHHHFMLACSSLWEYAVWQSSDKRWVPANIWKFYSSSLPLWWISKVPCKPLETHISQKIVSNKMALSIFLKYVTEINKNSKRYLLPDQARFPGIIKDLLRWAGLLINHLCCSETCLPWWDLLIWMFLGVFSDGDYICLEHLNRILCFWTWCPLWSFSSPTPPPLAPSHETLAICLGNPMA